MNFKEKVFLEIKKIPRGKVSTYKIIAIKIKNPNSFRAVANALNKNNDFGNVPCHRVVRSNGFVGGYVKGQKAKILLLKKEGIIIKNNKINLERYLFN